MRNDAETVSDIRDACLAIREFTLGIDRHGFEVDKKTQSAVYYQFVKIGEAAKRLSQAGRGREPILKRAAGLRDVLVHRYDRIDRGIVWGTIERDVPLFEQRLEYLLASGE